MYRSAKTQTNYPLHLACEEGDFDKIKALIKKKHDINGYDDKHWTPLHCAANNRQLLICKQLLKLGANPTAVTSNNATALHYLARLREHAELINCLKLLVEKGAEVNHLTYQQLSPLHEACSRGSFVAAQFLIENGAKIDQLNTFGETPLHLAVRNGNMEIIELLMRKGARLDVAGKEGTPNELAERFLIGDNLDRFKHLCERLSFGANVSYNSNVITNYLSLPQEVQAIAQQAKLKPHQIDANFDLFLDLVRHVGGDRFLPPKSNSELPISYSDPFQIYTFDQPTPLPPLAGKGEIIYGRNKQTKQRAMIKRLPATNRSELKNNPEEIEIICKVQSPSVVTFLHSFYLPSDKEHWIVMEAMEGGYLREFANRMNERELAYVVLRMVEGISHLHGKHIAHRNISSSKFFVERNGNIRLVDFGSAVDLCKSIRVKYSGTPCWMAPEIIKQEPQSTPVDIWALGITIIELAKGEPPFARNKLKALFTTASEGVIFDDENYSLEMIHFVGECLKMNPSERQTAKLLLKHKWLHSACTQEEFCSFLSRSNNQNNNDNNINIR